MIPIISDRERVTWLYEEKRALDRAATVLNQHGDKFQILCGNPLCPHPQISLLPDPHDTNNAVLSCGCRDRAFKPKYGASHIFQPRVDLR